VRDALKKGVLAPGDEADVLVEAVAKGVISAQEAGIVSVADRARRDVIRVDDFPPDYWHQKGGGHEK
jgi:hypothetical protein